jgi:hypothetical protein
MQTAQSIPLPRGQRTRSELGKLAISLGVVFPLAVVAFELFTHACQSVFFDPLPSWLHAGLAAGVPLSVAAAHAVIRSGSTAHAAHAMRLLAIATGVGLAYALLMGPLYPAAGWLSMAVPFFVLTDPGAGLYFTVLVLAVWAPLAAFAVVGVARTRLRRRFPERAARVRTGRWAVVGIGLFVLADLPGAIVNAGFSHALRPGAKRSLHADRAVELLRRFGDEQLMVRASRTGPHNVQASGYLIGLLGARPIDSAEREKRFFRVTGRALAAEPPVRLIGAPIARPGVFPEVMGGFDEFQGGEQVGHGLGDVFLTSSKLQGDVYGDEAFGYLEWTLVFRNDGTQQREARARVQLPPGAVISRVTLWVDGEEREASFASKSEVRAAYEGIVRQQRDPLLVTADPGGEALVQCFPIAPGGEMQIRIGVTTPLGLVADDRALLVLPHFTEQNFDIAEGLRHVVDVHHRGAVPAGARPAVFRSQRVLQHEELGGRAAVIEVPRGGRTSHALVSDARSLEGALVVQEIERPHARDPEHVIAVLDGSRTTGRHVPALARGLVALGRGRELTVVWASDAVTVYSGLGNTPVEQLEAALGDVPLVGGQNNVPGLVMGLQLAAEQGAGALLWIRGPQPVLFDAGGAERALPAAPEGLAIFDVALEAGPNRLAGTLERAAREGARVHRWIRSGGVDEDLAQLSDALRRGTAGQQMKRRRLTSSGRAATALPTTDPISIHRTRLWAWEESQRIAVGSEPREGAAAAGALARRYELVTPWSGAVVLETDEDYLAASLPVPIREADDPGLDAVERALPVPRPEDPVVPELTDASPVPEPGSGLLFAFGLAVLAARAHRDSRSRARLARSAAGAQRAGVYQIGDV